MRIPVLSLAITLSAMAWAAAPSAGRIDEIAAFLPDEPGSPKARISNRAAWTPLSALPEAKRSVALAEAALSEPVPACPDELYLEFTQNGNRSRYERPYSRRAMNLDRLVLGECLENSGRFLPKIEEYVAAICDERSWTLPAHDARLQNFNGTTLYVDLGSAARALLLAQTRDQLLDVLPQPLKDRIEAECDRRVLRPYLVTCRDPHGEASRRLAHWWYYVESNWNSVCNGCSVRAALALVRDRRVRAEFVESAERTAPFALNAYTDDGYCSEGMGYWNYGYGHHLKLGLAVREATGGRVDLFANPKNRAIMLYPYGYRLQGGRSPNFADGGGNVDPIVLALQRQVFPDLTCRAAESQSVLAGGISTVALRAFGQEPPRSDARGMDVLPDRSWFPDAQVLISRLNDPARSLALSIAMKGGHNAELHNHNDVGSYAIMLDGVEMCGDPGGEQYTRRTFSKDRYVSKVLNSFGHPVPVVGGRLQSTGRKAAAKVLSHSFSDEKDVLVLDCTAAYPSAKTLKSLVRTMTFDRAGGRVSISDRAEFTEPTAFEAPVVTYRDCERVAGAGMEFALKKGGKGRRALKMRVTASDAIELREETIENAPRPSVRRLAFALARPAVAATIETAFTVR